MLPTVLLEIRNEYPSVLNDEPVARYLKQNSSFVSVEELKKKWRGMRDTFGRELKKVTTTKSGQEANSDHLSKWPYFKMLLFLKPTMSRRDLKGNIPPTLDDADSEGNSANTGTLAKSPDSPVASNSNMSPSSLTTVKTPNKSFKLPLKKHKKRNRADEIDEKLLQIEEKKLHCFQETLNDSDSQFLMSLAPYLKELPKHRKLVARAKLQQVLIDEQNLLLSKAKPSDYSSDCSVHVSTVSSDQSSDSLQCSVQQFSPAMRIDNRSDVSTLISVEQSSILQQDVQEEYVQQTATPQEQLSSGGVMSLTDFILHYNPQK
ncbi:uncharacterized protein LOC134533313 [Bacillus rossius redtenbacheri]|uniref:uncharacterized protein LOC134533313 n=1 Tax=Bacillus rossius redtenbacheri TaxID=93214 RepID=UPI002FDEC8B7